MYLLYHTFSYLSILFLIFFYFFCLGERDYALHFCVQSSALSSIVPSLVPLTLHTYYTIVSGCCQWVMLHKVCEEFLCNLYSIPTTAFACVYGPARHCFCGAWSCVWRPSLEKPQTYLLYFFQIEMSRMLCMGGGFREKIFFDWSNHFVLGTTILKPFFNFGLREK